MLSKCYSSLVSILYTIHNNTILYTLFNVCDKCIVACEGMRLNLP